MAIDGWEPAPEEHAFPGLTCPEKGGSTAPGYKSVRSDILHLRTTFSEVFLNT